MIQSYDDWFNYCGYKLQEELEDWVWNCPTSFFDDGLVDIQQILEDEYESYVGEAEDRAYDEYKDSLLDI